MIGKRPDSVFVPTLEDFPQAIRTLSQTYTRHSVKPRRFRHILLYQAIPSVVQTCRKINPSDVDFEEQTMCQKVALILFQITKQIA